MAAMIDIWHWAAPWVVLGLGSIALIQTLRLALGAHIQRRAHKHRLRRAATGEADAEALLERSGYRIVSHHPRQPWTVTVDGEPRSIELQCDYIVADEKRHLAVEVKTGAGATISHPATRRQMLEYRLAYDVDGVLLADMERRSLHEIAFADLDLSEMESSSHQLEFPTKR